MPDPYRWLEDDTSAETAAWVEAQNSVTLPYLERIPFRAALQARVLQLNDYEKYSAPLRKGPYFFFSRNSGLQNQSVLFIQPGLDGLAGSPDRSEHVVADGTVSLSVFAPSKDATHAVYGISRSGSDWQSSRSWTLPRKTTLDDTLEWVKVSGVAWHGDGFFYSRYPAPPAGQEKASINENHQVFFHRIGTSQSQDVLVYEDAREPAAVSHACRRPRTNGSRSSRFPSAARARMATRSTSAISRSGAADLHAASLRRRDLRRLVRRRRQRR